MTMDKDTLSYARSAANDCSDYLHLAYFEEKHTGHWIKQSHDKLAKLADLMGYTITRKPDREAELRTIRSIEAAGMGGNGFAGAEYAAHVLTVAMRNGGA